jgi:hypothetical protein
MKVFNENKNVFLIDKDFENWIIEPTLSNPKRSFKIKSFLDLSKELSWKNKWNWFPNSKILTWLIANPLVALTDAWHLFGLTRDFSIFLCIPIISGNWWLILLYPLYRGVFHVFFTKIFNI